MQTYTLTHLADHVLLRELHALVTQDRATTAALLAHLAEVDERKLYLPAAYPSMYVFCVNHLHMSEDTALKRIQAARATRKFPAIFAAVADGRLHLSAVVLLAPHLTQETAIELLGAAAHKTKAEIAQLLAGRFPQPDVPSSIRVLASAQTRTQLVPEPVAVVELGPILKSGGTSAGQLDPEPVVELSPQPAREQLARPVVAPLSPGRFEVRFTFGEVARDKLSYAKSLLGHALPSGDIAEVIERGLDQLIEHLEQQKFAKSARSRPGRNKASGRYVPAEVRRTVWQRDGGKCTFVGESGRRCQGCARLEFDHVQPVARGGDTTSENVRLRCRAHNQYEAERTFGTGFMARKRNEARCRTARTKAAPRNTRNMAAHPDPAAAARLEALRAQRDELIPLLRALGFRVEEALRGAAMCDEMSDAALEDRVRCALSGLGRERFRRATQTASPAR